MKHTVLARKWRPKKFADLIGQQNSAKILTNVISSGRLHHAYLLTGTRGVGKTTIARIIAKALNCLNPVESEPCGICENCTQIDGGSFVDVIEIDAASNTGVDNIRELIDNSQYSPTSGKYKIYIIDEVHMLSKSAFNAMLKTLEEPPAHVIFILATTDLQKVPITVISRCLQLKLRNLLAPEISDYLAHILILEQEQYETDAISLIAKAANGSMRDALSILDQAIAFSDKLITSETVRTMLGLTNDDVIIGLLEALANLDSQMLTERIQSIYSNGYDLENVLQMLQQKLCELSLSQLSGYPISPELKQFISIISINDVQLYFEIANLGLEQLAKSGDKYPVFTMTMLRMLAFHIGTSKQQDSVVHASNFKPSHANQTLDSPPKAISVELVPSKVEAPEEIARPTSVAKPAPKDIPWETGNSNIEAQELPKVLETASITTSDDDIDELPAKDGVQLNRPKFDGAWIKLILELKTQLGEVLFPFVENSKLKSYDENKFELIIDIRYESAFDSKRIQQLEQILSEYFANPIEINISFAGSVENTLKEKSIQEHEEKQQNAQIAIQDDAYLLQLCDQFGAKIIPNSIKPLG